MLKRLLFLLVAAALALAGCAGAGGKNPAAQAVQGYYQAIVAQNPDKLASYTCSGFEDTARVELDSFQGVKTELQDLNCQEAGKDGDFTLVKCTGKIVATYGNEKMDFPIAERVHRVQQEGGDWRVCGYQ